MGPSRTRNVGIQRPRNHPRAATPLNSAGTERQSALALMASEVKSIWAEFATEGSSSKYAVTS